MKVSELKPGMLLRFKEPMGFRHMRDHDNHFWLDFIRTTNTVDPLIIYLGQKEVPGRTYYGGYRRVRQVLIDGQTLWMWPESWKHVEPAEKREND
jgi:hypothetical protein